MQANYQPWLRREMLAESFRGCSCCKTNVSTQTGGMCVGCPCAEDQEARAQISRDGIRERGRNREEFHGNVGSNSYHRLLTPPSNSRNNAVASYGRNNIACYCTHDARNNEECNIYRRNFGGSHVQVAYCAYSGHRGGHVNQANFGINSVGQFIAEGVGIALQIFIGERQHSCVRLDGLTLGSSGYCEHICGSGQSGGPYMHGGRSR
jgi:hypothetical protein